MHSVIEMQTTCHGEQIGGLLRLSERGTYIKPSWRSVDGGQWRQDDERLILKRIVLLAVHGQCGPRPTRLDHGVPSEM